MPYVYIIKSLVNSRYYIGSTTDLKRRLSEHNSGKSKYTNLTKPFLIVFQQEFTSLSEARKIERKLKSFKSKNVIEKIVQDGFIKTTVG